MSILSKNNPPQPSTSQIRIKEVRDGLLVLPNQQFRQIMEVSSINFELMSDEEQDVLLTGYQSFLNSLSSPIQILVRVREINIDGHLEKLNSDAHSDSSDVRQKQASEYADFISSLVRDNKILTRKFYVILPFRSPDGDFDIAKEQLKLSAEMVSKGLSKLKIQSRVLGNLETLNLFYSYYSPSLSKSQPLNEQIIKQLERESI